MPVEKKLPDTDADGPKGPRLLLETFVCLLKLLYSLMLISLDPDQG